MGEYLKRIEAEAAVNLRRDEIRLAELTKTKEWENLKLTADVTGIFDPSPSSDSVSLGMSMAEGDWVGAILSGVSLVPWGGDLVAKPFKLVRATRTITRIEREAAQLAKLIAHHKSTASRIARRKLAAAEERARRAKEAAERFAKARKCKSCPEPNKFGTRLPTKGKWEPEGLGERGNSRWTSTDGTLSVEYKKGYPDFSTSRPASLHPDGDGKVEIEMQGDSRDFTAARDAMRRKLGNDKWPGPGRTAPKGYTWHHNEDGATMELVRSEVHDIPHMGGDSLISGKDNLKQESQF